MRIGRAAAASTTSSSTTTTSATTMPPTPLPLAVAGSSAAVAEPSSLGCDGGALLVEEEEEEKGGDDGEGEMGEEVLVLEARGVVADLKGLRWSFRQLVFPYMKVGGREGTVWIVVVVISHDDKCYVCINYPTTKPRRARARPAPASRRCPSTSVSR